MPAGRKRSFNTVAVLEQAIRVFWRLGFDGASLTDLTDAMGINRPSLYAAFGSKNELFVEALQRYWSFTCAFRRVAFEAETALETTDLLLREAADLMTAPGRPPGCLLIRATFSCTQASETTRRAIFELHDEFATDLERRYRRAVITGELAQQCDTAALAAATASQWAALATRATLGATREELLHQISSFLGNWRPPQPAEASIQSAAW